jgi:phospholipid-translocating ATPase
LAVTITKEAMDDYKRYQRDQEANSQRYERLVVAPRHPAERTQLVGSSHGPAPTEFIPSSRIRVGDIIRVHKNQRVPADMVLLQTSDQSGGCFIRTDQLDGETDLKFRYAIQGRRFYENINIYVFL